ncbi:PilZ domain-containing protein [Methylocucumis oryzae]|uniref:PilZ domain-containing protein n=1 Tax=Methylocucumis oryzae TaxID=1632867 RepID=A0A0F3IG53_9GAMM|nr:PilZ domain-containing protein [Methylocucumis oryzae]KJV05533.1 hypothetical protein VZ94_17480 [Methylocucumis oryzae]
METPTVDIFIPELQLSGEAEVVRLGKQSDGELELALQFKALDCQFGKWPNKRMSYRKTLKDQGRIIFNRKCYRFFSSNASVAGLMIQIPEVVSIKPGTVTLCEFRRLMLNCKVKVVWVQQEGNATVLGLQYLNIEKERVKGVPHFYSETASESVSLSHVDDLSLS